MRCTLLLLAPVLAGCTAAGLPGYAPAPDPLYHQAGATPIWCYQTLADPDCFESRQGGPPNRLINAYTTPAGG
jgi:hypothetical protein